MAMQECVRMESSCRKSLKSSDLSEVIVHIYIYNIYIYIYIYILYYVFIVIEMIEMTEVQATCPDLAKDLDRFHVIPRSREAGARLASN